LYAYISGIVDSAQVDRAVIDANGVGYELFCSAMTLKRLREGQNARLYTHLHLAEGVMALYGFYDPDEKDMFRRLLSVTRVGPKLALSVLSILTPSDVAAAIVTNNAAAFDRVPGMGRKTAQRVLLELKERVEASDMLGAN
jgi:Holliday junction DNA helicase RuvA